MDRLRAAFYIVGTVAFLAYLVGQPVESGTIVKPNTFSSGGVIFSSQVNDNFDTIYSEFNGNIESANILNDTIIDADINSAAAIYISKLNTAAADFDSNGLLRAGVVDTVELAAGAADNTILATDSVTTSNILDGEVKRADLDTACVTSTQVDDEGITRAKIDTPERIPVGTIFDYGGTAAPTGWLLCGGQAVNRTTYADLFSAIGTNFGVGDGSTTFNVPDLRGRVAVGADAMDSNADNMTTAVLGEDPDTVGSSGGAETHTLTVAEMPAHTHSYIRANANDLAADGSALRSSSNTSTNSGSTGGDGAHNNIQPTLIVLKIIKY